MKSISLIGPCFLWLFCFHLLSCGTNNTPRVPMVVVESPDDIESIENLERVPLILYHNQLSLNRLPVAEKKEKFIAMILPSVLAAQEMYRRKFEKVDRTMRKLHKTGVLPASDSVWLNQWQEQWHASSFWDLRKRLKPNPTSLILAQAAIESGWGESRMFREANNLFGVWSFDKSEPRIRANAMRGSRAVYLRKYPTVYASVYDHLKVYGTVAVYRKFRNQRIRSNNPLEMANYLNRYSELGSAYVRKVKQVIRQNSLQRYDSAKLDESIDPRILADL